VPLLELTICNGIADLLMPWMWSREEEEDDEERKKNR